MTERWIKGVNKKKVTLAFTLIWWFCEISHHLWNTITCITLLPDTQKLDTNLYSVVQNNETVFLEFLFIESESSSNIVKYLINMSKLIYWYFDNFFDHPIFEKFGKCDQQVISNFLSFQFWQTYLEGSHFSITNAGDLVVLRDVEVLGKFFTNFQKSFWL